LRKTNNGVKKKRKFDARSRRGKKKEKKNKSTRPESGEQDGEGAKRASQAPAGGSAAGKKLFPDPRR